MLEFGTDPFTGYIFKKTHVIFQFCRLKRHSLRNFFKQNWNFLREPRVLAFAEGLCMSRVECNGCFQCGEDTRQPMLGSGHNICWRCEGEKKFCSTHGVEIDREHWCSLCVEERVGKGKCPTCGIYSRRCSTRRCGIPACTNQEHVPIDKEGLSNMMVGDSIPELPCNPCGRPIACHWCNVPHFINKYSVHKTLDPIACEHPWCTTCSFNIPEVALVKERERRDAAYRSLLVLGRSGYQFPLGVNRMIAAYVLSPGLDDKLTCCEYALKYGLENTLQVRSIKHSERLRKDLCDLRTHRAGENYTNRTKKRMKYQN